MPTRSVASATFQATPPDAGPNRFHTSAMTSKRLKGRTGSASSSTYSANSSWSGSPSSIGRRLWPLAVSVSATASSDRCFSAFATSAALTPQCSPSSRLRISTMALRCGPLFASIAKSHSLSAPIERLFMLAEPIRRKRSSIAMTLEWIMVSVPSLPSSTCGYISRTRWPPVRLRVRQKRMRPLRMVLDSTQDSCWCGATISTSSLLRSRSRLARHFAIGAEVTNWFSM